MRDHLLRVASRGKTCARDHFRDAFTGFLWFRLGPRAAPLGFRRAFAIGAASPERRTFCENLAIVLIVTTRTIVTIIATGTVVASVAARALLPGIAGTTRTVAVGTILSRAIEARTIIGATVITRTVALRTIKLAGTAIGARSSLNAILAWLRKSWTPRAVTRRSRPAAIITRAGVTFLPRLVAASVAPLPVAELLARSARTTVGSTA
ncbi:hypothetical protein NWI01_04270 [Nitrobacter winogradskyi]|uniref:Uncharacterized protein n=1 Tax=Nitrobacter winogradskyi TaxID=913 RepID=A0A4Y3W7J1_NITWI|nr:hypothetical protein NWI01_04270 [Nitrobacter winogradskyi]